MIVQKSVILKMLEKIFVVGKAMTWQRYKDKDKL